MIVRNATFLWQNSIFVWHASNAPSTHKGDGADKMPSTGKPPPREQPDGFGDAVNGNGMLMTCTLNLETKWLMENFKCNCR